METSTNASEPIVINSRNALAQILAVMVKNFLMLSFGMNIGYPTILIGGVVEENVIEFANISENDVSWLGSLTLLTVVVGSSLSGIATQPLGRKRSMQLITIPFIICWIMFYYAKQIWHLYFALALMGFFGGLVEAPFSAYVSEISQPYLRGILAASGSIFVLIGVFIQFLLGTLYHWRTCALVSCGFPVLTLCFFCLIPESPYWLLLNNKLEEAKKGLAWLRGWTTIEEIEPEIQDMLKRYVISTPTFDSGNFNIQTTSKIAQKCMGNWKHFTKKSFLWPFGLVTLVFFLGQFTGASTLQTYAISIFATLDVPINTYYATVFLAVAQLLGSGVGAFLVYRIGKRRMLFISLLGVCVANMLIGTYAYMTNAKFIILQNEHTSVEKLDTKWIPLTLLLFLSFIDHCGNYMLPWILIGEIFAYETRSVGCGISVSVSYLLNFLSNNLFIRMVSEMTLSGTYYLYGSFSLIGIILLYFILPETEGKTLEEISDHFAEKSKLDNKVGKKEKTPPNTGQNNLSVQCEAHMANIMSSENFQSKL